MPLSQRTHTQQKFKCVAFQPTTFMDTPYGHSQYIVHYTYTYTCTQLHTHYTYRYDCRMEERYKMSCITVKTLGYSQEGSSDTQWTYTDA